MVCFLCLSIQMQVCQYINNVCIRCNANNVGNWASCPRVLPAMLSSLSSPHSAAAGAMFAPLSGTRRQP